MSSSETLPLFDARSLPGAAIGRDVSIRCASFAAAGPFRIGDDVRIEARHVVLGAGAEIGAGVVVEAIRGQTALFSLGDHALIDQGCNVMVPHFASGDYTRIFRNVLISGYKPVTLGHNCWVGQGAVLNSAETLAIGNNVRMGGSQIWTHVASGEVLEGSRFYNEAPVTIEDDVWLMGFGHLISPGVTLARGTVVMAGSVVSKSTEAYHTYSGVPARDITDKLPAWDRPTAEQKWEKLKGFVREFLETHRDAEGDVILAGDSASLRDRAGEERLPAHLRPLRGRLVLRRRFKPLGLRPRDQDLSQATDTPGGIMASVRTGVSGAFSAPRAFEDISVGDAGELTRHFGREEVAAFARLIGDDNPIHLDEGYAATTPFGRCIVHGPLYSSLIGTVLGTICPGPGTILARHEHRFLRPVFVGDDVTRRRHRNGRG